MNTGNRLSLLSRAWLVVGLLWLVACLNYLDRNMIVTMRGSLKEAIPMTDAQFGLLTSVFLWVYGGLSPLAGFLADRFSRSRVIIVSLLFWSAITWLTGHAKTFDQLLFSRALMGISEACYIPAGLALIADYHRGPTRSLATGIHMSGIMAGAGLGGLGGFLAEHRDWSYAFKLFGVFGVMYSIILMASLRDVPRECKSHAANSANRVKFVDAAVNLFGSIPFIMAVLFWGLLGLVGWAINGWMPTYLNEQFHLSQGVAGLSATGYMQAASLVGVLVGGALADFWSLKQERGRINVTVIGLCVAAPGVLLVSVSPFLLGAIAGLVLYGFARSFADSNMMPILCMVANERYRATGYGILNFFSCLVGGVAIYAGGVLRDASVNVRLIFLLAALSLLVCGGLLYLVKPVPARAMESGAESESSI